MFRFKEWEVYKPADAPNPTEILPGQIGGIYDVEGASTQFWALPNILIDQDTKLIAKYEEVGEVTYNPSEVTILVHAFTPGEDTALTAEPNEIGTAAEPVEVGTVLAIIGTLTKTADGSPIEGETLRLYYPDGTEVGIAVTDVNGQAIINYTVRQEDDMKYLSLKYLGD